MATVTIELAPANAQFMGSSYPQAQPVVGSNFPIDRLLYDATNQEEAFWQIPIVNYGSGNIILKVIWYAINASSGNVVWQARVAAITPETDTQDPETKSFATANYVQDTHLGTVGKRLHSCIITVSNLDSIADADAAWIGIARDADSTFATDDMANDAALMRAIASYSDT